MRILFRDKWKVPYLSNCNVMVCRFYPGDELNTTLNTLSCNVFFLSSQIRTYFKNINSLTLCHLLLVHFGRKMQVFTRGSFFYYYCISFSSKREWASSAWVQKYSSSTLTWIQGWRTNTGKYLTIIRLRRSQCWSRRALFICSVLCLVNLLASISFENIRFPFFLHKLKFYF